MEDAESKVCGIVKQLNQNGKGIPERISDIKNFPAVDYNHFLEGINCDMLRLSKFSFQYESTIFNLISTSEEKFQMKFSLFVEYIGPVISIVLAVYYSWWFMLLAPILFFCGLKIGKNAYLSTIFRSATSSEIEFCFLYFCKQISVYAKIQDSVYYWGIED